MLSFVLLLALSGFFLSGCGGRIFVEPLPGISARSGLDAIKGTGFGLVEIVGEGIKPDGTLGKRGYWRYRFRGRQVTIWEDGTIQSETHAARVPLLGGWRLDSPQALSKLQKRTGKQERQSSYRLVLRGCPARWETERATVDALTGR
ncbi:MAG: hypothetical protein ACM3YO_05360 [Bacteroidota bacterium]